MVVKTDALETLISKIKEIYGKNQVVYIQGSSKKYYRGEVYQADEHYFNKNYQPSHDSTRQ